MIYRDLKIIYSAFRYMMSNPGQYQRYYVKQVEAFEMWTYKVKMIKTSGTWRGKN